MNKDYLERCLQNIGSDYIWTLYFFNTRKRRNAGFVYESHKVRFKKNDYINSYANQVINAVVEYQLSPIGSVEDYDGYNTKISCDKIAVVNDLINDSYTAFVNSLAIAEEANLKGRYKGYVLEGQPNQDIDGTPITFIKLANPMIPLDSKKAVIYKKAADDSLDGIDEQYCRLYLTMDSILIGDTLYNFTHSFEKIFNIEQTLHNVKAKAIETIVNAGFIANPDDFVGHAQSTNARVFISLNDERIARASSNENRFGISQAFGVPIGENGLFLITTSEQTGLLLKYLCYKTVKDAESNDILEANGLTKLNIGNE